MKALHIAVVSISSTRTLETDESGKILVDLLCKAGHREYSRTIKKDDVAAISAEVLRLCHDDKVNVVITTGGSGLMKTDVTVEALQPYFEKVITGFGRAFHNYSLGTIGLSTLLGNPIAGIIRGKIVFCLPGSKGAVRDGWEGVIEPLLNSEHKPCNFVEVLESY